MNRAHSIKQMETSISDPIEFQKLSVPENKEYKFDFKEKRLVDNSLGNLHEKNIFSRDITTKLTRDGQSPTCLYGLPKIHKALIYRLPNYIAVISQTGSATYTTAKPLLDFISSITKNEFALKD